MYGYIYVCMCRWRPDDTLGRPSLGTAHLVLETESLADLELSEQTGLASQKASGFCLTVSASPKAHATTLSFWASNSGPYVCKADP